MPVYNTTFLNTSTGFMDTVTGVNNMVDGLYAALVLFTIFVILFIAMKRYDTAAVFLTSSFVTSVVGVLFFIMGMIGVEILAVPLVALLISIFYHQASK